MPEIADHASGGGHPADQLEHLPDDRRKVRSTAEALADNIVRHSGPCAERDTLIEGLRERGSVTAPPLRAAVFLRTDKRGCGQLLALGTGKTTFGRSWDADARLEDPSVSRFHAEVSVEAGRYVVSDLGSANGTFVNDLRVKRAVLDDGSVVRLGSRVTLRFSIVEEDEKVALSHLHELGHYDPLTQVHNRRYLSQHLASELAFAERHGTSISVVLLDIDNFKSINDVHGHPVGDHVLTAIAAIAAAQIRTEDVVARYGGEEFMIVLRETPVAGAEALAERIRRAVAETLIEPPGGAPFRVTLSAGCASLSCTRGSSIGELIQLADRRLYLAKARGRNLVVGRCRGSSSLRSLPATHAGIEEHPSSRVQPMEGLAHAFDILPVELRTIVGLHYQERCSFAEIAAILDISEAQARELFQAAMARLRVAVA